MCSHAASACFLARTVQSLFDVCRDLSLGCCQHLSQQKTLSSVPTHTHARTCARAGFQLSAILNPRLLDWRHFVCSFEWLPVFGLRLRAYSCNSRIFKRLPKCEKRFCASEPLKEFRRASAGAEGDMMNQGVARGHIWMVAAAPVGDFLFLLCWAPFWFQCRPNTGTDFSYKLPSKETQSWQISWFHN